MADIVHLPTSQRKIVPYTVQGTSPYPRTGAPARCRVVYAAAHVVADPLADTSPLGPAAIDFEATLRFRHHLFDLGLGVAEAMDTAQRGMGLDWDHALKLVAKSAAEARGRNARIVAGAQSDQLAPGSARSLREVTDAYLEQCAAIEATGAGVVVMASREACRLAHGPEDYLELYARVLGELERPAILHWLGEMFDPALAGYFGATYEEASATLLSIITEHVERVDGVKCSLLDQEKEVDLRSRLPEGVRMYTGDDFDYPTTMAGDGRRSSDALLGAFDFAAPAAAWACAALDAGDTKAFIDRLEPTLPLARHVFSTPTSYYKTGVVFLAYLNGFQDHFKMVGGLESGRSIVHLAECFRLADQAGLLVDPELATRRMRLCLATAGIEAG